MGSLYWDGIKRAKMTEIDGVIQGMGYISIEHPGIATGGHPFRRNILLSDPTVQPERFWFGLRKRPVRRRFLAALFLEEPTYNFFVRKPYKVVIFGYGQNFHEELTQLGATIRQELLLDVELLLFHQERFEAFPGESAYLL